MPPDTGAMILRQPRGKERTLRPQVATAYPYKDSCEDVRLLVRSSPPRVRFTPSRLDRCGPAKKTTCYQGKGAHHEYQMEKVAA